MRLNPVMDASSWFMTSSFLRFISSISSRVMSRDSMYERSSSGFFPPPPKLPKNTEVDEAVFGADRAKGPWTVNAWQEFPERRATEKKPTRARTTWDDRIMVTEVAKWNGMETNLM